MTDADGLNDVVFNYHWMSDDAEIVGATGSTYTLTSDDMGKAITVKVDFTDDTGNGGDADQCIRGGDGGSGASVGNRGRRGTDDADL